MQTGIGINKSEKAAARRSWRFGHHLFSAAMVSCIISFFCFTAALAQNKYESHPIGKVDISLGETDPSTQLIEQYRFKAREAVGTTYSSSRIRDAIDALYKTKTIDTITVAAALDAANNVDLVFNIKRKTQAQKVSIVIGETVGDPVTEQELLFKLNLLTPGTAITEQTLRNNADEILDYLRERGFYKSEVTYEQRPLQTQNDVGVTFKVNPNVQTKVGDLVIKIDGYTKPIPDRLLKLHKGEEYSRDRMLADVAKVKDLLKKDKFLAPELDDPKITYDSEANTISVVLT